MAITGVYPCWEEQFKVNTGTSSVPVWSTIADCESFSVSFDNNVEEWTPFNTEGWTRRLMTGKAITVSVTAKRNVGDTGNDAVANLATKSGAEAQIDVQWTFADGAVLTMKNCVVNVTALGAGDSTAVAPLEFEVQSNGVPVYTAPPSARSIEGGQNG